LCGKKWFFVDMYDYREVFGYFHLHEKELFLFVFFDGSDFVVGVVESKLMVYFLV